MIDNPAYKGIWSAPDIPNPAYVHDDTLYNYKDLKYVGFELWQVKSGTIFDNIIVTDSLDEAFDLAKSTWEKNKDAEKEMMEKVRCRLEVTGGGGDGVWCWAVGWPAGRAVGCAALRRASPQRCAPLSPQALPRP